MNSTMTYTVTTVDSEATMAIGHQIAQLLKGGEMIELVGDLGAGKTTLVQGLAQGLGVKGEVTSPTFTLSREYPAAKGLTLCHFDLYRLQGHDIVTDEMEETLLDAKVVTVAEWADHGGAQLPAERLKVELYYGAHEDERRIVIIGMGERYGQLVKELRHALGN
jgi:tRNA threonylcarbamoyladenosine biosynthesis protein TsaE